MARINLDFLFSIALLLFLLHGPLHSANAITTTTTKSKGFSMKLIDIDSIHSPLYPGNLTQSQRIQRDVERSTSRHLFLNSMITNGTGTDQIRPQIRYSSGFYMVQLAIGTPPSQFLMAMDTGSSIIWLQCEGCNPCIPNVPNFTWKKSRSYFRLPCSDSLCAAYPCVNNNCFYNISYAQPATSRGVLASDTFTFSSSKPGVPSEQLEHIGFGCGFSVEGFPFGPLISGILGLSKKAGSLMSQLPMGIPRRFSYCLLDAERAQTVSTYLRFGEEAILPGPGIQSTPFVDGPVGLYYIKLNDISINDMRMGFEPGFFDPGPRGGGVVIDSGSNYCDLKGAAYDRIENWLRGYFAQRGLMPIPGKFGLRLCYEMPAGFSQVPYMTFHFDGGDMELSPANVFVIDEHEGYFCLGILRSGDDGSILGSWQQKNYRFVYDLDQNVLSWQPDNCERT